MEEPKLRFPEFTDKWEEKQFDNIATISGGYAFDSKKMTSTPAKYQIVKMGNLYQGNLDLDRTPSFIEDATEKELEYLIQENDIGITLTGTVNKHDYGYSYRFGNEKNLLLNQRLGLIRAKQNVNAVFLSSIVKGKNFLTQFYNISTGGTGNQTNVSTKGIEKIRVSIPILKEQQKIADFLFLIDDIIQVQEEEISILEEQKKGMMQNLFNREMRFKADDGSEYPEWEVKLIGDILKICHGKDYKHLSNGNIPVLGTGGVITFVDKYLCDWECVLIGRKGTIDKPQYMNTPFWSVDTLFYSKPEKNQCVKFQYYLFETINWKVYDESTGVPSLSASTIEKISILIPCLEEQHKIADCLSAYDEVIQIKKDKLEVWKEIKKGLLQQMFV